MALLFQLRDFWAAGAVEIRRLEGWEERVGRVRRVCRNRRRDDG